MSRRRKYGEVGKRLVRPGRFAGAYNTVFAVGFSCYFLNSVIVTVVTLAVVLSCSLGAAFMVMRRATPASRNFKKLIVIGLAVPIQAIVVPLYCVVIRLGI
jgi:raffinose/stachyose/melibiose transport system permease protein